MRSSCIWIAAALAHVVVGYGSMEAQGNVPAIGSFSPSSAVAGSGGFNLIVNGSNFREGAIVRWRGSDRVTTYVSGGQLRAAILASDIAQAGVAQVTVLQTVGRQERASDPASFTITVAPVSNPIPAATSLSPRVVTVAPQTPLTLTVNGSNFVPSAVVRWNGAARQTDFVSSTRLTAAIPVSDLAAAVLARITVFNPGPGGGVSQPELWFQVEHPRPVISSFSPTTATRGANGFVLVVNGTNFLPTGSTVRWKGSPRSTEFVSTTQLKASILAADLTSSGDVAFFVATQAGSSTQLSGDRTFTVYEAIAGVVTVSIAPAAPTRAPVVTQFYVGGSDNPARVFAGRSALLYAPHSGVTPTHWRVSPSASFSGATWRAWGPASSRTHTFTTSETGERTLYFQYRYLSDSEEAISSSVNDRVVVRAPWYAGGVEPVIAGRARGARIRELCPAGRVVTGLSWRVDLLGVVGLGIVCDGTARPLVGNADAGKQYSGDCSSRSQVPTALVRSPPALDPGFITIASDRSACVTNPLGDASRFSTLYAVPVAGARTAGSASQTIKCDTGAFPIGVDIYVDAVRILGIATPITGVAGLGFVCAKPD